MRKQLTVSGMIKRLHRGHTHHKLRRVTLDVFHQFMLGARWASNQYCTGILYRGEDSLIEARILGLVAAP